MEILNKIFIDEMREREEETKCIESTVVLSHSILCIHFIVYFDVYKLCTAVAVPRLNI